MPAERLEYEDDQFDLICGFAIIHHLDLDLAIPELFRVLKKGGRAIFAEPLKGNPFIDIFRRVTPKYRTPDESPLNLKEFTSYTHKFTRMVATPYLLTSLLPISLLYIPIFKKLYKPLIPSFLRIDDKILKPDSFLGRWAWYSIIELVK